MYMYMYMRILLSSCVHGNWLAHTALKSVCIYTCTCTCSTREVKLSGYHVHMHVHVHVHAGYQLYLPWLCVSLLDPIATLKKWIISSFLCLYLVLMLKWVWPYSLSLHNSSFPKLLECLILKELFPLPSSPCRAWVHWSPNTYVSFLYDIHTGD